MQVPIVEALKIGIDYAAYRELILQQAAEGTTSGPNQSESMVHYTKLNAARMKRLDKTTKLEPSTLQHLQEITNPQTWLIITETWCGDAAQILPILAKMQDLNPMITLKHVFRDENPELMDLFLTNGSRSIPMVIMVDEAKEELLGVWGPRPSDAQQMVVDRKADTNPMPYDEFQILLQKWYLQDKGQQTQDELREVLAGVV